MVITSKDPGAIEGNRYFRYFPLRPLQIEGVAELLLTATWPSVVALKEVPKEETLRTIPYPYRFGSG